MTAVARIAMTIAAAGFGFCRSHAVQLLSRSDRPVRVGAEFVSTYADFTIVPVRLEIKERRRL